MEPEQPHADLGVSNFGLQVVVQAGISQDNGPDTPGARGLVTCACTLLLWNVSHLFRLTSEQPEDKSI